MSSDTVLDYQCYYFLYSINRLTAHICQLFFNGTSPSHPVFLPPLSTPQFSLFGSRSTSRATNPPSSSSSSSSPLIPSAPAGKRTDRLLGSSPAALSKAEFLERVRRSNQACQQGEFALAVCLYTEALSADPQNCILYSNRSAAHLRLGQYSMALDDAIKARLINPKWPKVRCLTHGGLSLLNHTLQMTVRWRFFEA